MPRRTTDVDVIKQQLKEAKTLYAKAEAARATIEVQEQTALENAWQCGKRLNLLKENVGFGNWLTFLESNWPEISERTAQSYMKIDSDNPGAATVADLKFDSIRKYRIAKSVPKKEKVEEPGDQSFSKPEHHSTVVNECMRFFQRIDAGQQEVDEDELRRDLRPVYERMQRLYGDA
jgi:Protein of unknown function (DUF3102)